ncbi:MAG: phosphatase PAP2 family protein, partial [Rickettsiales bacterium]
TDPRPYINLRNEVQSKEIKVLVTQPAKEAYVSFPSRKMMIITILVIAIWPALTENFRWAGIWLAFTVGWSQMAVGVNYPSDLVGGFSIALVQMMIIRNIIYSITLRIFRIGDA